MSRKRKSTGFLDSEGEAELEEAAWREIKRKRDYASPEQWREIGEFLCYQTGFLV